jgi:hypothetical protein
MQTVGSREYKLMLRASKLKGDEAKLLDAAGALWADLAAIIVPRVLSVSGTADIEHKRREVRFLDTADKWLRTNDYVVRERVDLDVNERVVTLKFRHPDRYISQGRDMAPTEGFEPDMKFEEDIKPEFLKLYSFSSNTLVPHETKLATLADVAAIYPGLPKAVDVFPEAEPLEVVGGFTAYERVVKGTSFQIRKNPATLAECSLTLWYAGEVDDTPVVAELSFKYEDPEEGYTAKMSKRAYDAYMAIQAQLGAWLNPKSMTKTAYVYSLDG